MAIGEVLRRWLWPAPPVADGPSPFLDRPACVAFVLAREGGYSNHPADKGGETNWGITVAVARAHGYAGPMRAMPKATALAIYDAIYWPVTHGFPPVLWLPVFDTAVNCGPTRARRWGKIATSSAGPVVALLNQRWGFYQTLIDTDPTQAAFRVGWRNRLAAVAGACRVTWPAIVVPPTPDMV